MAFLRLWRVALSFPGFQLAEANPPSRPFLAHPQQPVQMASVRAPVLPAAASVLSKPAAAPSTSSSTLSYLAAATPAFSWPLVALGAAVGGIAVAGLVLWQR